MTLTFQALWTLTGLGTVVFATCFRPNRRAGAIAAVAFTAVAAWSLVLVVPSSETLGLAAAAGAVLILVRPETTTAAPFLAGGLAAAWGALIATQDVPVWLALPGGAAWIAASMAYNRRAEFAPPWLREQALAIVAACGLAVAMLPGTIDGWHAAVNLSVQSPMEAASRVIPGWALGIGASSLALGAVYSIWSRR